MSTESDIARIRYVAAENARTYEDFRWSLVQFREEQGLTIQDVGGRLGWSSSTVQNFEASETIPSLADIRRYALAVGGLLALSIYRPTVEFLDDEPTNDHQRPGERFPSHDQAAQVLGDPETAEGAL